MKNEKMKGYKKPTAMASKQVLREGTIHLAGYVPTKIIFMKDEMRNRKKV